MLGRKQVVDAYRKAAEEKGRLEKELKELKEAIEGFYPEVKALEVGESLQLLGNEAALTVMKQERESYAKDVLEAKVAQEILDEARKVTEFLTYRTK